MTDYPAISGITDASQARMAMVQNKQIVHAPLLGLPIQPLDADLTAIAALATTTYGRALLTMADAAATRTVIGLGTSDTPNFADLVGTITNDNAAAGNVGEVIAATLVAGSATAIVNGTAKTVTSISLTAGDWDVTGNIGLSTAATTNVTFLNESISLVTNTNDTTEGRYAALVFGGVVPGLSALSLVLPSLTTRLSLASTTTVYLIARAFFTVSTCGAYGTIYGRRAR